MDIEMSLEDHISSRVYPDRARNSRSLPKPYTRATRSRDNNGEGRWRHDRYEGVAFSRRVNTAMVSSSSDLNHPMTILKAENLHWNVTEEDVQNLFNAVGEVQKVKIQFDNAGRSEGIAFVTFVHPQDAADALEQYQKVLLDDMPMELTLLPGRRVNRNNNNGRESSTNDKILKRLGPVNVLKRLGDKPVSIRLGPRVINDSIGGSSGRGPLRHSQGRRNGNVRRDPKRENVSKEDLDQDMDSFMSGVSTMPGEGIESPALGYANDFGITQGQ
ncbi:hypothetical protein HK096_002594 [Nowakowskiella sp. JEL0078]|nr:hypothetical protein HK096_002594 [Nowakowskiella sp. JEL0078]